MSAYSGELFPSYSAVEARREWEIGMIQEKLGRSEMVDTAVCRVERIAGTETVRFGLKRGKLLYLFKYPDHNVEREKHRNVITRARFIKRALENAGYRLIPWDFKKGQPPTFWEEQQQTMEEEDDDLYGPSETTATAETKHQPHDSDDEQGDEPMDVGLESGDDDDDDDDESDSDIEIIIDKPQTAPKPVTQQPQESKAIKIEAPPSSSTPSQRPSAAATIATAGTIPTVSSHPGTAYPAVKTSTIDVNSDPIYPPVGKPVSQIDIDADLAESSKPWRLPGADQSDYFNYGFDEFTWEMYRQRQSNMTNTLAAQKAETAQFQQMFGMGGGPPNTGSGAGQAGAGVVTGAPTGPSGGGAAGPGGMPPMPGMNEEQMQMMMAQMQGSGMDLANMDFNTFMQMAGGMGGGFPGGQQQGGFGAGQQGNQGGGGRGGGGGARRGRGGW